jgi:hypothetical protein
MFVKLLRKSGNFSEANIWTQMTTDVMYDRGDLPSGRYPQKWFFSSIGIDSRKKSCAWLFESVMTDQANFNYFNPLIFFRWVEQKPRAHHEVI